MKNLFQIAILSVLIFGTLFDKTYAQSGPVECKIKYDYDAAGNRIKREYKCEATWMPWDNPPNNNPILSSVYPNPTSGVVTGVFTEPTAGAYVVVTNMGGAVIFSHLYGQQMITTFTIDISAQPAGSYLLTISAFNKLESYMIIKL